MVHAISPAAQKRALRTAVRCRRRDLAAAEQSSHALAVANAAAGRLSATDIVAVYLARDGEVDLAPLIDTLWRQETALALPVLADGGMFFARYRADGQLLNNRYGIPEPQPASPIEPTVVLAPLVAFDNHGQRLGMGGGYYDRYFAAAPKVRRIGIAHECQRVDALPVSRNDVPLAVVVTECGWHTFEAAA